MNAVLRWWRLPDHYDWLSSYLHARNFTRPVQLGMATICGAAVLFPANAVLLPDTPQRVTYIVIGVVFAVVHLGWAALWLTRWPSRAQSVAFGMTFSASIGLTTWLSGDPSVGVVGCTALALSGAYLAFFHTSRMVTANFVLALVIAAVHAASLPWPQNAVLTLSMIFLVIELNAGVPLAVQLVVHALGFDLVQSDRDPLTGLLNRRSFEREIIAAVLDGQRRGSHLMLTMIDLDRFKALNDAHGHHTGDAALVAVSEALTEYLPDTAVLARVGGEEFLAADIVAATDIADLAERARHAVTTTDYRLTASVGTAYVDVSVVESTDIVDSLRWLTAQADVAMYRAKRAGGNRVRHLELTEPTEE
ncbi:sensor domain-containing diguanylate cyclase [Mycobacterium sp. 236(2023)]|uniref:sensor domain-containing diguanylate cyclase n=1 Tax=Mycobacterium sp. 236(2023) TaxID=3038163 RepID=UPI002415498B|nr:sensor domain-containing diguanylate cyclase [Mycobacterium sp. 236(2023)]MDG4664215.1 diguanylate cyclase [Mycobacterium sp. 236(2023)]